MIATATALQGSDVPEAFPERDRLFRPKEWINDGGAVAAGPRHREMGILYTEIDAEAAQRTRRSLDICGHYARPDIFSVSVNRKPREPATFKD